MICAGHTVYMRHIQDGVFKAHQLVEVDVTFKALLMDPLTEYASLPGTKGPILMLFDALDEAGSFMMQLLFTQLATLPGVSFIFTSRYALQLPCAVLFLMFTCLLMVQFNPDT